MKKIYFTSIIVILLLINIRVQFAGEINNTPPPPVITFTPLQNTPKIFWPVNVTANVTGSPGIDSVWVRWFRNNTSTGVKTFKLNLVSGSTYRAAFNSDTSQVNFNDSIFYRIIAQDNSSGHLRDSTALFSFKLTSQAFTCGGNGTSSTGVPFYTLYMDSRTQMLYTAAEIAAGGGIPNMLISSIAFKVLSVSPQAMNGFSIKLLNTTSPTLIGFIGSGWIEVYSGTYSVPDIGWQIINFQNSFTWTGNNLAVEICFHNTAWISNSNINGTSIPNMCWHIHADNNNGCSMTGGLVSAIRPNFCFGYTTFTGNQTPGLTLPDKYSLSQNYPNPFNPKTLISYELQKSGFVILSVCDVLGREVQVLVNEKQNAGSYNVEWDAGNYPSGVYFYRINAGDFTDVKKMVLIK